MVLLSWIVIGVFAGWLSAQAAKDQGFGRQAEAVYIPDGKVTAGRRS